MQKSMDNMRINYIKIRDIFVKVWSISGAIHEKFIRRFASQDRRTRWLAEKGDMKSTSHYIPPLPSFLFVFMCASVTYLNEWKKIKRELVIILKEIK